jgi:hypothetical protein
MPFGRSTFLSLYLSPVPLLHYFFPSENNIHLHKRPCAIQKKTFSDVLGTMSLPHEFARGGSFRKLSHLLAPISLV